jgi:SM-20-related protein
MPEGAPAPRGPFPPGHQFSGFLSSPERSELIEWTLSNRSRFIPSRIMGNVLNLDRRVSERLPDLGPLRALFERRLTESLPEIFRTTGTRPFEIEYFELELAAHGDGAFFANHVDLPIGPGRKPHGSNASRTRDRVVSAVYYFHIPPKRFSGGALRLYRFGDQDGSGDFIEFQPKQNSLVVFPSWARHEVRRVGCPGQAFDHHRFAVNAWLCRTLAPGSGN